MYPWRLVSILEDADPLFKNLFYPKSLRCRLDWRVVQAIEEHWPAYFPTRKECRGSNWSLTIPENERLYRPQPKSLQQLKQWKKEIRGTFVEMRAYGADISWRRFAVLCKKNPRIRPLLRDFGPLVNFLIKEETMWNTCRGAMMRLDDYFQCQMQILLAPVSPYRHADPARLRFLQAPNHMGQKIRLIQLMRSLLDRPLMILAILQKCAAESEQSEFWLPIQQHIKAIIQTPSTTTFRKAWLEHAMQASGAIKRSGKSCPRKWAKKLISGEVADLNAINTKAIEVNSWLKARKQPSIKNVIRAGKLVFAANNLTLEELNARNHLWLFSWMIVLWLEKHFGEVADELKNDIKKIRQYYRRFYYYLNTD